MKTSEQLIGECTTAAFEFWHSREWATFKPFSWDPRGAGSLVDRNGDTLPMDYVAELLNKIE